MGRYLGARCVKYPDRLLCITGISIVSCTVPSSSVTHLTLADCSSVVSKTLLAFASYNQRQYSPNASQGLFLVFGPIPWSALRLFLISPVAQSPSGVCGRQVLRITDLLAEFCVLGSTQVKGKGNTRPWCKLPVWSFVRLVCSTGYEPKDDPIFAR